MASEGKSIDPRFLLQKISDLHACKSYDYGSGKDFLSNLHAATDFGVPAWVGVMIRINEGRLSAAAGACSGAQTWEAPARVAGRNPLEQRTIFLYGIIRQARSFQNSPGVPFAGERPPLLRWGRRNRQQASGKTADPCPPRKTAEPR